jgi:hypothetical protein
MNSLGQGSHRLRAVPGNARPEGSFGVLIHPQAKFDFLCPPLRYQRRQRGSVRLFAAYALFSEFDADLEIRALGDAEMVICAPCRGVQSALDNAGSAAIASVARLRAGDGEPAVGPARPHRITEAWRVTRRSRMLLHHMGYQIPAKDPGLAEDTPRERTAREKENPEALWDDGVQRVILHKPLVRMEVQLRAVALSA